jgi:hypothetical protein
MALSAIVVSGRCGQMELDLEADEEPEEEAEQEW